ncbi:MAG: branched-chain alpha-keto acid dehydrogenase subunit, partial [Microbacterium sp.]|nr:branched-chain alpha-keto acid dehydrogenase subunit [Microbacterium sp.]
MSAPLKPSTQVFRLPDLGEGLTEAGLVQWLVAVGDTITTDQPIAEVETAKSVVELPSPFAGVVIALHGAVGDTIDVGAPVLEVADPGSASDDEGTTPDAAAERTAASSSPEHEAYREEERAGSGNVLIGYGTSAHTTKGRRRPAATSVRTDRPTAPASTPAP